MSAELTKATYIWKENDTFEIEVSTDLNSLKHVGKWTYSIFYSGRRKYRAKYFHTEKGALDDALLYLEANYR
jgi:hypothetical protein